MARKQYPETALLTAVAGVGVLIALTFILTLEDPHRFPKSRAVGAYLGMKPRRQQSGGRDPELGISKEGDVYLRKLLVQGAPRLKPCPDTRRPTSEFTIIHCRGRTDPAGLSTTACSPTGARSAR